MRDNFNTGLKSRRRTGNGAPGDRPTGSLACGPLVRIAVEDGRVAIAPPCHRLAFKSASVTINVIGSRGDGSKPIRS